MRLVIGLFGCRMSGLNRHRPEEPGRQRCRWRERLRHYRGRCNETIGIEAVALGRQISAGRRARSLRRAEGHNRRVAVIDLLESKTHAVPDRKLRPGIIAVLDSRQRELAGIFPRSFHTRFRLQEPTAGFIGGDPRTAHVPPGREVDIHLYPDPVGFLEREFVELTPFIREERRPADIIRTAPVAAAD